MNSVAGKSTPHLGVFEQGYMYISFVLGFNAHNACALYFCVCVNCSAPLSMCYMEKRYRNKIIIYH